MCNLWRASIVVGTRDIGAPGWKPVLFCKRRIKGRFSRTFLGGWIVSQILPGAIDPTRSAAALRCEVREH